MGKLRINGKTYNGTSVVVRNNTVIIDGKQVENQDFPTEILSIEVTGTLGELVTDGTVQCDDVKGSVMAGGSVNCDSVGGDVKAGGSVNCDNVSGNVYAGGSVNTD